MAFLWQGTFDQGLAQATPEGISGPERALFLAIMGHRPHLVFRIRSWHRKPSPSRPIGQQAAEIVARSLYSHKEIFLRELISNASDACDRLRYLSLTEQSCERPLLEGSPRSRAQRRQEGARSPSPTTASAWTWDDLTETLGTIARSGTQAFVAHSEDEQDHDMELIGQFGVGFYSALHGRRSGGRELTRKAAPTTGPDVVVGRSRSAFTVEEAERDGQGTTVTPAPA